MVDELGAGQVLLLISDCPGTQDDLLPGQEQTGNRILKTESMSDGGTGITSRKATVQTHPPPTSRWTSAARFAPARSSKAEKTAQRNASWRNIEAGQRLPRRAIRHRGLGCSHRHDLAGEHRGIAGVHEFYIRKG